jgi:hypothetical protein
MIDFATLKGVTIPEGVVKQISDANGNVLWSAEKMAKITITSLCQGINGDTSSIIVTSTKPFAPVPTNPSYTTTSWTAVCWEEPNCIVELPVGSTIACTVRDTKTAERRCYVELNGTKVLSEAGTYVYTVTRDAAVHVTDKYAMGEYGMITITE